MNYYPFHIGDYLTETAHLSWLEDCAYRRLLDLYYSREQRVPQDVGQAARLCRAISKEERKAVETVLSEFFTLTESGWEHTRCEVEIQKARESARRARENGGRGGRPPKAKPTANPEETQPVISGNPDGSKSKAPNPNTKPIYSVPIGTGAADATPTARDLVFANGVPLLTVAGVAEKNARSMLAGLCKRSGDEAVASAIAECAKARPVEPVSWLQAVLAGKAPANKQQAIEDRNRAVADAWVPPELRGAQPQETH
jgi:uncharacterized protein YdaU (DUF1376 family)